MVTPSLQELVGKTIKSIEDPRLFDGGFRMVFTDGAALVVAFSGSVGHIKLWNDNLKVT